METLHKPHPDAELFALGRKFNMTVARYAVAEAQAEAAKKAYENAALAVPIPEPISRRRFWGADYMVNLRRVDPARNVLTRDALETIAADTTRFSRWNTYTPEAKAAAIAEMLGAHDAYTAALEAADASTGYKAAEKLCESLIRKQLRLFRRMMRTRAHTMEGVAVKLAAYWTHIGHGTDVAPDGRAVMPQDPGRVGGDDCLNPFAPMFAFSILQDCRALGIEPELPARVLTGRAVQ